MRYTRMFTLTVLAAAATVAVSCQPKNRDAADAHASIADLSNKPQPARAAISAAPKDAQWTILCKAVRGSDHVVRAKAMKDSLLKTTQLRDWRSKLAW